MERGDEMSGSNRIFFTQTRYALTPKYSRGADSFHTDTQMFMRVKGSDSRRIKYGWPQSL